MELAAPLLQFSSSTSLAKEGKFVGNDKFAGVKELNPCLPVFYNNQRQVVLENWGDMAGWSGMNRHSPSALHQPQYYPSPLHRPDSW